MNKGNGERIVVLGIGNELLMDEGIGVHVARSLAGRDCGFPVEVVEAGTVADCWFGDEPIDKLVVIDAVLGGGEAGAIYRFSPEEVELETVEATSIHQLGFAGFYVLSEIAGIKPKETVIIGVEPKDVGWGLELSEELRGRIPAVVEIVLKEVTPGHVTG